MKCPSEIELNEYAEDRLDTRQRWEVQAHLEACACCRGDLEGLAWATERLGLLGGPQTHPSDEELAAMAEGRLEDGARARMLGHLGQCPECAAVYGALPKRRRAAVAWQGLTRLAAAAALLLAIGVFYVSGGRRQEVGGAPPLPRAAVEQMTRKAAPEAAVAAPATGVEVAPPQPVAEVRQKTTTRQRVVRTVLAEPRQVAVSPPKVIFTVRDVESSDAVVAPLPPAPSPTVETLPPVPEAVAEAAPKAFVPATVPAMRSREGFGGAPGMVMKNGDMMGAAVERTEDAAARDNEVVEIPRQSTSERKAKLRELVAQSRGEGGNSLVVGVAEDVKSSAETKGGLRKLIAPPSACPVCGP